MRFKGDNMTKRKEQNIQKTTAMIMGILFFSRILGFIREMIVAKTFGRGMETDAFYAAFAIPDLMYDLLVAGALSSGFMPVFSSYLVNDDEDNGWKAANTFITVALIIILIFNVLGITFAKQLIPIVAYGNTKDPEKYALTVKLTRIMFTGVTFTVLAGLCKGILESYKIFLTPAIGPVLYNVGIIAGAIVFGKGLNMGIYGMAIGVIIGAFFNFFVQYPDFRRVGKRFKFEMNLKNEGYKRMLSLMVPALIGLSINRINLLVNTNVASVLDTGSITALRYAQRIMMLPVGIFGAGILTTIFPVMNSQIAKNKIEEYKDTLCIGLKTLFFITVPCVMGLIVLNLPIVRLLFRTGQFTEADARVTAIALSYYSIGALGNSAVPIIIRAFYSIQDTKTPLYVGLIIAAFNTVLNIVFVKFSNLAVGGIALTSALASCLEMVILYILLSKKMNGLRTRELSISFIKSSISAFAMGGATYMASKFIESKIGFATKSVQLVNVATSILIAIVVYFAFAYILRMPELDYVTGIIKKRIKK